MSEPFIGEVRLVGFNFAPRGWAFCDGQILAIQSYTALFSLLGTTYGGDGRTTFGLPDLRGRTPIGVGTGPGLTPRTWGAKGGVESVTLNATQIPPHSHTVNVSGESADSNKPQGNELASGQFYHATSTSQAQLAAGTVANTGGGQSHENMEPFLVMRWCIALTGIYPSRS